MAQTDFELLCVAVIQSYIKAE